MPTYEYRCSSCGERLEVVQSFSDNPLTECPACRGLLKKVFQPVGIAFKGSGFYKNDSRKSSTSATSSSSNGSDSSAASTKTSSTSSNGDGGSSSSSSGSGSTSSSTPAATKTAST